MPNLLWGHLPGSKRGHLYRREGILLDSLCNDSHPRVGNVVEEYPEDPCPKCLALEPDAQREGQTTAAISIAAFLLVVAGAAVMAVWRWLDA